MTIGQRLRELRTAHDMSQDCFAIHAGVSQWTISSIERGKHAPYPRTLERVEAALTKIGKRRRVK